MKLIIAGATGLVGSHLLEQALAEPRVTSVVALSRRALPITHPKLQVEIVDFDNLPTAASWWKADAVLCALGTTIKDAGSQEAFRKVDETYPIRIAELALAHGAKTYVLNSAMGADANSRFFYNRVKGEVEQKISSMSFESVTFVRPGLIGGDRPQRRVGEEIGKIVLGALGHMLPKKFRINPAEKIAGKMLAAGTDRKAGRHIIASDVMI